MKVQAEVTIDLDSKRRVWSEMSAEGEPEDATEEFVNRLAKAAAVGAIAAYEKAAERHGLPIQKPDPLASFGDGRSEG